MEYNKVYHNGKVGCYICGITITRKTMFKHQESPSCKVVANVCKLYTEMSDENHKEDIYSLGRTKLKTIMYGEFDGGIKLSEEEQNRKIKRCEKQFGKAVKRCNEFNKINKELRREGQRSPTQPCHPCCQQQRQQCHPAAAAAYTVWHVHAHFYAHAYIIRANAQPTTS